MHFLFPSSMLRRRSPDEMYEDQVSAFQAAGLHTSLISLEALQTSDPRISPPIPAGETVVYRGWMLTPGEYEALAAAMTSCAAVPLTSPADYLSTHYLPNWYPLIQDLTPETRVFPPDVDLECALSGLGWNRFFIKDFVKSVKTSVGSIVDSPAEAALVVAEMEKYRGTVEGGFCVRRVEDFIPDTERRYFVIHGHPYAADPAQETPRIVFQVAERMRSRFFSVDIVLRSDGTLRVVEVGDGQVSDIVGWTAERLASVWEAEAC